MLAAKLPLQGDRTTLDSCIGTWRSLFGRVLPLQFWEMFFTVAIIDAVAQLFLVMVKLWAKQALQDNPEDMRRPLGWIPTALDDVGACYRCLLPVRPWVGFLQSAGLWWPLTAALVRVYVLYKGVELWDRVRLAAAAVTAAREAAAGATPAQPARQGGASMLPILV